MLRSNSTPHRASPRRPASLVTVLLFVLLEAGATEMQCAESKADDLINQAQAAELKGDQAGALALANKAVALEPKNPQCFWARGRLFAAHEEHSKALADFDQV